MCGWGGEKWEVEVEVEVCDVTWGDQIKPKPASLPIPATSRSSWSGETETETQRPWTWWTWDLAFWVVGGGWEMGYRYRSGLEVRKVPSCR